MKNKKILIPITLAMALASSSLPSFAGGVLPICPKEIIVEAATYATIYETTNMYTSKYDGEVVCSIPKGAKVEIRHKSSEWSRIKYDHKIGYIKNIYLIY